MIKSKSMSMIKSARLVATKTNDLHFEGGPMCVVFGAEILE